jgi:hypothetical protein
MSARNSDDTAAFMRTVMQKLSMFLTPKFQFKFHICVLDETLRMYNLHHRNKIAYYYCLVPV